MTEVRKRDHNTERHLAVIWTQLGFDLKDIGIEKLAKRCEMKGKHWADPSLYDQDFLEKSGISLDRMEQLANEILEQASH